MGGDSWTRRSGQGRLGPSERTLGGQGLTWRPEEMPGHHTGKQVKTGGERHFGVPPRDISQPCPNFTLGNLVPQAPACANSGGVTQGRGDCGSAQSQQYQHQGDGLGLIPEVEETQLQQRAYTCCRNAPKETTEDKRVPPRPTGGP